MTAETFAARMAYLAAKKYPVIALDEAVNRLKAGKLPAASTVQTFDDGWLGTFTKMAPILKANGFPGTVYVSSYYMEKQTPVFNMIVPYILLRALVSRLNLRDVDERLDGVFDLRNPSERTQATQKILTFGDAKLNGESRQSFVHALSRVVGFDIEATAKIRLFEYANSAEMRASAAHGIDIQLHTHRHRSSEMNSAGVGKEIADNRQALKAATGGRLVHLCYPSGGYDPDVLPRLAELGIESATTTRAGFNYAHTPMLELNRFLDAETISMIEFEAEMSGFFELLRKVGIRV